MPPGRKRSSFFGRDILGGGREPKKGDWGIGRLIRIITGESRKRREEQD